MAKYPENFDLLQYKAILADCDGVLLEMPRGHYEALNKALNIFGYNIAPDDHIQVYNGLPTSEKLKMMSKKGYMPYSLHDIIKEKKKQYTKEQVKIRCKPEYNKLLLLKYLKKQNLKLACCSNAIQESVEEMLECAGILKYFDEVIGNDVGFKPKPAPDIYLEAMKRFNLQPKECLVIEDAFYGVEAAKASGADVIEVKDSSEVNLSLFLN